MKKVLKCIFSLLAVVFLAAGSVSAVETNAMAPDFTLTDSNGAEHSLSDFRGKYVVLEWVNYQCPFVVKHYRSNNMQGLQKKYTAQDVVWLSINSSAPGKQGNYPPEQINEIMSNADASPTAYLIDESGDVGRLYSAQTTPHMYIVDPDGKLIYQGAIDDNPSFDPDDIPESNNYVQMALDAALSGQPVKEASTKSYGCSVKY